MHFNFPRQDNFTAVPEKSKNASEPSESATTSSQAKSEESATLKCAVHEKILIKKMKRFSARDDASNS